MHELPPEVDGAGSEEYKLVIVPTSGQRTIKLQTQMAWRLSEGRGTAVYRVGYEDDGRAIGITYLCMEQSLRHLHSIASGIDTYISQMEVHNVGNDILRINTANPFYRQVTQGHLASPPDRYIATVHTTVNDVKKHIGHFNNTTGNRMVIDSINCVYVHPKDAIYDLLHVDNKK